MLTGVLGVTPCTNPTGRNAYMHIYTCQHVSGLRNVAATGCLSRPNPCCEGIVIFIAGLIAAVAGCGDDGSDAASGGGTLSVATTVATITSIAANIGGDRVRITGIVPEGTNSHTFEPKPSVAELLSEALKSPRLASSAGSCRTVRAYRPLRDTTPRPPPDQCPPAPPLCQARHASGQRAPEC